jgi:large repetitive protein
MLPAVPHRGRLCILTCVLALLLTSAAHAAGSPNISLAQSSGNVLFGTNETVTLTASNPTGQPWGYNLTYEAVLPAGISYVSSAAGVPAPTILTNEPTAGKTTLIWSNVADLSPASNQSISFTVSHSTVTFAPANTYTITTGAYVNTDPRWLPKFDNTGAPIAGATSFTGSATQSATSTLTAIDLTQSEPSSEGEILRGLHDHRTIYTETVRNNLVKATNAVTIDAWLPAGLEYLACGVGDHTTNAPTNAGSPLEYPGAPAINASGAPGGLTNCIAPTTAVTVNADPDGAGPQPTGIYTHLTFSLGNLAAAQVSTIQFVAAIPIRENTIDWNGAAAGNGVAPATANQSSNLDNNSGPETFDEEALNLYAIAQGTYNGTTAVNDTDVLSRTAEDLKVVKTVDQSTINQGQDSTWTIDVSNSEYRYIPTTTVTDTVPNGLCPVDVGGPSLTDAECMGTATDAPSIPWDSAIENADGTWTVQWTIPRQLEPSDDYVITLHTHTRTHYQANGSDTTPVFTNDGWSNAVSISGADFARCVAPNIDCVAGGTKIDHDEVDGVPDTDVSSVGQAATGPTIDKTIQNTSAKLVDCTTGSYTNTPPGSFSPGAKVCYRLQLTFPGALDTRNATVTDFLPPGMTYVAGSAASMPDNDATIVSTTVNGNTVTWSLGTVGDVVPGRIFDAVVAATVDQSPTALDGDITANLMKVSYSNTAGQSFSLRDEVDTTLAQPQIDLLKGVRTVNGGAVNPPNTDGLTVPGASAVQYRVDVENTGSLGATAAEIWDRLPSQLHCAQVGAISSAGTCVTDAVNGDYVKWTGVSMAAHTTVALANQTTLTYTATLPGTLAPATTLSSSAGVRSYQSSDGQGGTVTWFPSANVDPSVAAASYNAAAANDPTNVTITAATLAHTDTTAVTESGNAANQATIGERVAYTSTATIPDGTTMYAPKLTIPIPAQLTYNANLVATLNGVDVTTIGWTASFAAGTVTVTGPATYVNAAGSGTDTLSVSFDTFVTQAAGIARNPTTTINDTATLTYNDAAATLHTLTSAAPAVTVVEPLITTTLAHAPASASVLPDQDLTYTVTTANSNFARVSVAHDTTTTVTVPAGLTPYTAVAGSAVPDLGTIGGGVWHAGTRTITFSDGDLNVNTSSAHSFVLHVDDPATSGSSFTVSAEGDTTSMAGTPAGPAVERTNLTTPNTGYKSTTNNTIQIAAPLISKAVDRATATIGEQPTYTLTVTLSPNVNYFDTTVRDVLPANTVYDGMVDSTCTSGCALPTDVTATQLPQAGQTTGYFIGDVPFSASTRIVTIHYHAHVGGAAVEGNTLTNTATAYDNITDKIVGTPLTIPAAASFDQASTAATATLTVHEPAPQITKSVAGNAAAGRIGPTEAVTYTLAVKNNGLAPMYNVHVTDQPDADLVGVTPTTGAANVTTSWVNPGDPMAWDLAGPIAPGATVNLAYTASLNGSATLHNNQNVDNTARVASAFGLPAGTRAANPGFTYKTYGPVTSNVHLTTDMPVVTIVQTTTAAGFPDSAPAQLHTPFGWRIVVTDTAAAAAAKQLTISDILPNDWTYVPGSAQLGAVPIGDPAIAGQTLTWTNVIGSLAAGTNQTLTFTAIPQTAAALNRGVGAANPHIANASVVYKDATGANADADGPYAAGPDPAQGILANPNADISTTIGVDKPLAIEGDTLTYTVHVHNAGPSDALNVTSQTTFPASETITSVPPGCTQFLAQINCSWPSMASGADNSYVVTVRVNPLPPATITVPTAATTTSNDPTHGDWNASVDVGGQQPHVTIDKAVATTSGPGLLAPADTATYTLTVSDTGAADAYDVAVTDLPDPALVNVVDTTGAADATQTWTPGDHHMKWTIPHVVAGSSVTLQYTAQLTGSGALHDGQAVDNTAAAPHYFAGSAATRAGDPAFPWTDYTDGGSDSAHLNVDLPTMSIVQTTGAPGFPDSAAAQIHNPFTWRIVFTNTSAAAQADQVDVSDVLPPDWSYDAGSAQLDGFPLADPLVAGQTVTFNGAMTSMAAGDSHVLTFTATPSTAAALNGGIGPANPHIASATLTFEDASGAGASADGPYTAGPDTAQAILDNPPSDISTHITVDHPTAVEGDPLIYTVHVLNAGPSDALNVVSQTTFPGTETITSVPPGCSQTGQVVECDYASMAIGDDNSYQVGVQVHPAPPATITVPTHASTTSVDLTHGDWDDQVDVTTQHPKVSITKAVSGHSGPGSDAQPGDTPTYTLTVTNSGSSDAYDVAVTDLPDAALVGVVDTTGAADATQTWTPADHHMKWTIPHIAAGSSATLQYTTALDSGANLHDGQAIDNTAAVPHYFAASAATRAGDPTFAWTDFTDGGSDSAHLAVDLPVLAITDTTGAPGFPESANARIGVPFGWHLTVTNTSAGAGAHTIHMTDVLPPDWTFDPGSVTVDGLPAPDPAITGQTLTFSLGSLAAGSSHTIDFSATPTTAARTDPQPHVNSANADWTDGSGSNHSADGPYVTANDPASATLQFPILTVTKTAATPTVDAGAATSYTLTIDNIGDAPATNVDVADTLPAGIAYAAGAATAAPSPGFSEADATAPSLDWKVAQIDPAGSVTITVPVTLDSSLDAGLVLHNTVAVTSMERPDPVSAAADITTTRNTDVSIVKTGPPAAKAGTDVAWALHIHNAGPSDARSVVVTDPLPPHTSFVSADSPCTQAAGTVTCALGTMTPGQDITVNVSAHIASGTTTDVTNTASVTTTTPDTDPSNDSSQETVAVGNQVDLAIAKTSQFPHIVQTLDDHFTLTVTDAGPSDSHGTKVVDTLPAGLRFVAATPQQGTCADAGQVITCDLGDVVVGTPVTIDVEVRGDEVGPHTNTATVSTALATDINPANDTATADVIVDPLTDLSVTKDGPAQVAAGGPATYTMTATNHGPSPATGVVVTDQLPAGVVFASGSAGCTVSGQTASCPIGDLAVGQTATATVTVTVPAALGGQSLQDTATVAGNEADLDLTNNSASVTTTVGAAADVRVVKHQTVLHAGGEVTYSIDVIDDGPSDAHGVVVTDPLPPGETYVGSSATQGSCAAAATTVTCQVGDLPNGSAMSIQILAKLDPSAVVATPVQNVAHVTSTSLDPNPTNDQSQVEGEVASGGGPSADLRLVKTSSVSTPRMGDRFHYTITVTNQGAGTATGVVVTDPVPANIEVGDVHATKGTCTVDKQLVRCIIGTVGAGKTVTIAVDATALRTGTVRNVALVAADGNIPTDTLTGASVTVHAARGVGVLTLHKRALRTHVHAGALVPFSIIVTAHHAAVANVKVCDRLPMGMVFVATHGARLRDGRACWTVKSLDAGQHKTFTLMARTELDSRGALHNHATAKATGAHSVTAQATVHVFPSRGTAGGGVTG